MSLSPARIRTAKMIGRMLPDPKFYRFHKHLERSGTLTTYATERTAPITDVTTRMKDDAGLLAIRSGDVLDVVYVTKRTLRTVHTFDELLAMTPEQERFRWTPTPSVLRSIT